MNILSNKDHVIQNVRGGRNFYKNFLKLEMAIILFNMDGFLELKSGKQ